MSGVAGARRSTAADTDKPASPAVLGAALRGNCPRCGAAALFDGPVRFADRCRACALDYTQFNVGDGPAAFLTLIVGGVLMALAITLELSLHPPFWVHLLLWVPLTLAAVVACLRLAKGALITLEYRNQAREGRLREQE